MAVEEQHAIPELLPVVRGSTACGVLRYDWQPGRSNIPGLQNEAVFVAGA